MFVHQSQLEHLLAPAEYHDPEVLNRERSSLFLPGWHFLATRADLPRPGDYRSLEFLGEPLLVRNQNGEISAYLNVCPHRHSRLRGDGWGHDSAFRCQYHGWEFQTDGRTGRIPEARCFRPFDRENARLVRFATQPWGEMTFLRLHEHGPSLEQHLGDLHSQAGQWFTEPYHQVWRYEAEYPANWKIVAENSLESYHIPCLHQKSFGIVPAEETCDHDLNNHSTTFRTPETYSWISKIQNFMVRSVGGSVSNLYTHHHVHPNLIFISMDVMRMAQLILPLAPGRTLHRVWVYSLRGTRGNPWAWMTRKILDRLVRSISRQILLEDAPIFAEVQRGTKASRFRGVIGTREERVYAFQRYIRDKLGPIEAPPARNTPATSS